LVGSSEAKKVPGLVRFFFEIFYRVFELPSPRNAQKPDKRKKVIEKKSVWDFFKGRLKKKKKEEESVGCFYVGLRFFGLFCKNLLHVILTPPARYQHPHDANNPQVGHWGNCEPRWWPQASRQHLLLLKNQKNKTANTQKVNSTGW
jgi:hypothetical protein